MNHYSSLLTVIGDLFSVAHSLSAASGHAQTGALNLLDIASGITSQAATTPTVGIEVTGTITSTGTVSGTVPLVNGKPPVEPLTKIKMIRGLTLGAVAFLIGVLVGRPIINWLRDRGIGKHIRIEGPASHQVKTGTPTMGGIIFLIPLVIVIAVFMDILTFNSLLLPLGIVVSCGILGGIDDLLSTVGHNRGGMTARFKMAWLVVISIIAACIIYFLLGYNVINLPFLTPPPIPIGIIFVPIAAFLIAGMANAVNFTDGLDGLAGGTTAIAFVSYGVIAFLQNQEPIVYLCFATVGSLLAFLWFNAHPAQVIMGDSGALTLGALLAVCALMTNQWVLLPLVGIVFVAETVAVILQVLYFKLTGGKRLFRMAPLHHHFEMLGWSETQVTLRFWMVSMVAGLLGVALALI
ncbi:MAG: phospho-N-acetylmuramoyl-pentapeptide-transferase [Chloroflexia bacterium]